jgi:hypothetical protein
MKPLSKNFTAALIFYLLLQGSVLAASIPKGNLALMVKERLIYGQTPLERLAKGLKNELRQRGYEGNIRMIDEAPDSIQTDENLVSMTLVKSKWETKKALSIPYLLNRLKRVFQVELQFEIGTPGHKLLANRISASQATGTEAQFLTNDKYDPDIFPDQSQRLILEDKAYSEIAKELADKLGERLK